MLKSYVTAGLGMSIMVFTPASLCDAWSVTPLPDLWECRLSISPFSTPQFSSLI